MTNIPVEVSAKHVHVTADTARILFGEDYTLTSHRKLSQPGQFATAETVSLVGPRGEMVGVRIVGPERSQDQVELSMTDAIKLGIQAPLNTSGDLQGAAEITIKGPVGEVGIPAAIVARRHIHTNPTDATEMGVSDQQIVQVQIQGERALTYDQVVVRVQDNFATTLHLDTDEGNACMAGPDTTATLLMS